MRETAAPVITPDGEVIGAILVFQDVTASRALQRQLAHSATHDSLTGLPNRSAFEEALKGAIETASRENRAHALCFIDLDRFKLVNDGAGHAAGDALLQRIGDVIRRGCRANDFAARIGGDEFALAARRLRARRSQDHRRGADRLDRGGALLLGGRLLRRRRQRRHYRDQRRQTRTRAC